MASLITPPSHSSARFSPKRTIVSLSPPLTPTAKRPRTFWDTVLADSSPTSSLNTSSLSDAVPHRHPPVPQTPSYDAASHVRDLPAVVSSPISNFTDSSSAHPRLSPPYVSPVHSAIKPIPLAVSSAIRKTQQHSSMMSPARPHTCSACGSSFARSSHLRLHIRTIHEKLKPFQCEQCPAAFGHVSSKYRHFRTVHLKRRDFACDRCGQTFAERAAVLKHCRTVHEGSRPYPCPTCGFRFHFKLHLSQHISTVHEKQRPHRCTICNACFGQRSSLNRHSRQIHGISTKK